MNRTIEFFKKNQGLRSRKNKFDAIHLVIRRFHLYLLFHFKVTANAAADDQQVIDLVMAGGIQHEAAQTHVDNACHRTFQLGGII